MGMCVWAQAYINVLTTPCSHTSTCIRRACSYSDSSGRHRATWADRFNRNRSSYRSIQSEWCICFLRNIILHYYTHEYLVALAVASAACNDCNVLLGPHIQVGMSLHHCAFAGRICMKNLFSLTYIYKRYIYICTTGSVSMRPSTYVHMICDIVRSLQQSSNFTHFFFVNGHGGRFSSLLLSAYV